MDQLVPAEGKRTIMLHVTRHVTLHVTHHVTRHVTRAQCSGVPTSVILLIYLRQLIICIILSLTILSILWHRITCIQNIFKNPWNILITCCMFSYFALDIFWMTQHIPSLICYQLKFLYVPWTLHRPIERIRMRTTLRNTGIYWSVSNL